MRIYILGAGKVGRAFRAALRGSARGQGSDVVLRSARKGWPKRLRADVVLLCARDGELAALAEAFRAVRRADRPLALLHCAGALGPEVLAAACGNGVSIGQFHPLLSFADGARPPEFAGAHVSISGDAYACDRGVQLAQRLGLTPQLLGEVDRALYHAAAALLANGVIGLLANAEQTLTASGIESEAAASMLAPLLRSVVDNVEQLGLPTALTGPIRRGSAHTIKRHLQQIDSCVPEVRDSYAALARAQLPLARQLGEATPAQLRAIAKLLSHG